MRTAHRGEAAIVFGVWAVVFGIAGAWLLHNNYSADAAQYSWASLRAMFDADTLRLENLGFHHPHGPLLLLAPLVLIPSIQAAAPFIVSATVTALLFTLWHGELSRRGYPRSWRVALLLLMTLNPAVLWSATGGGGEALTLLMFYVVYRCCLRMDHDQDIRSFIALGVAIAVFVLVDVVAVYLLAVLLPLLLLIVPIPRLRRSPLSVYVIIATPLLVVVASWLFFNWIFLGGPLISLYTYQSAYVGASAHAELAPWLLDYGGQFATPMYRGLLYVLMCYPVLMFLLWKSYQERRKISTPLVMMFFPVIGVGLATFTYFLASPLQITTLISASVMAEIGRRECLSARCVAPLLFLLAIGTGTSWYLFVTDDYSHVQPWTAALVQRQAPQHSGDARMGHWLAENRAPTLIDLHSGFRAVAARGDAAGLLTPFTHEYQLAMRSDRPSVAQIAVPNPDGEPGRHDQINMRFPQLYESGMQGYERVYDQDDWRVYRRRS